LKIIDNMFDFVGFFGTLFWFFVVYMWACVVRAQYEYHTYETYTMHILACRASSLLPIFLLFILLSIWAPNLFALFKIPSSIAEGYGVYCIFTLMIKNCGNGQKAIKVMSETESINPCCPKQEPAKFYGNANFSMKLYLYFRPAVTILATICFYVESDGLYAIFTFLAAVPTLYMLPHLFISGYLLYEKCEGLNIFYKLPFIKVSVGLILIEDMIQQILYTTGAVSLPKSENDYSSEDQFTRLYCLISLCEGVVLAYIMWLAFGPKMDISESGLDTPNINRESGILATKNAGSKRSLDAFICDMMNVTTMTCSSFCDYPKEGSLLENDKEGLNSSSV